MATFQSHENKIKHATVIIDAFRAFSTACYILEQEPRIYFFTDLCSVANQLKDRASDPVLVGKPEINSTLSYAVPNSPTKVSELDLKGRIVIHRTSAGGYGAQQYKNSDVLLAASFVNAQATANAIKEINPFKLEIIPLGHEGNTPTLEDDLCAAYIGALVQGDELDLSLFTDELKRGPGRYFFGADQSQYPEQDFTRCLNVNAYPFPIFVENLGKFSILRTRGPYCLKDSMSLTITPRIPLP